MSQTNTAVLAARPRGHQRAIYATAAFIVFMGGIAGLIMR